MGFDIIGMHPVDEDGKYFRNDIYSWESLWDFVCEVTGDLLTDKQKEMACHNDGFKCGAKTSMAIAKKLKEALDSGAVKKYERKHKTRRKVPPGVNELCKVMDIKNDEIVKDTFLEKNVRSFQHFCKRCNGFSIC